MLMAHPAVLQGLIEQYTALKVLHAERGGTEVQQRLDDVAYSLCISTGTCDIDAALIAARYHLPGARPEDDSVLSPGHRSLRTVEAR
ncbi:DUF5133 domain-containing protein [Streptomyces brasiliensis]|uniref:DUF5133 domain-containing protein n=1 Tax=Streptomyces brasiliensis TaxID=1954 RepID=A0A917K1P4_9ACTN|nr:DUF5133 domain-containing protein [Streptomyces brasiliensis]GGI93816.1 DUF5133 domain-containing protein [Streptomyces brasiliensis]